MSLENFRNVLLNSLSNIFAKTSSTLNYKLMMATADSLESAQQSIEETYDGSSINRAVSGELDYHGFTLDVKRNSIYEGDEAYRRRLLGAYDRPYVTKTNLKELTEEYTSNTINIEETID